MTSYCIVSKLECTFFDIFYHALRWWYWELRSALYESEMYCLPWHSSSATWWTSGRLQLISATKEMKKKSYQPIIDRDQDSSRELSVFEDQYSCEVLRDFSHISTFFVNVKVILQTSSAAQWVHCWEMSRRRQIIRAVARLQNKTRQVSSAEGRRHELRGIFLHKRSQSWAKIKTRQLSRLASC